MKVFHYPWEKHEPVAEKNSFQLCVGPLLNHVVIYIVKCIVWRGNLLAVEFQIVHFVQWEWMMPFSPGHFPGPNKKATLHSFFLSYLAEDQSKQIYPAWERVINFCLQFLCEICLPLFGMRERIQQLSTVLKETFFSLFLPSPRISGPQFPLLKLNSRSAIYDRIRSATYSVKGSLRLKLYKTSQIVFVLQLTAWRIPFVSSCTWHSKLYLFYTLQHEGISFDSSGY